MMAVPNRKAEFLQLVSDLFDHGMRSTTLLSEATGYSDEACRQALIVLGKTKPGRLSLQDVLGGLPASLRHRVAAFALPERRERCGPFLLPDRRTASDLELPTESRADVAANG